MKNILFDFNDILLEPSIVTKITSREDINPFDKDGFLPLIAAPMDTVVDSSNEEIFVMNKIKSCLPRGEKSNTLLNFESFSLSQFKQTFLKEKIPFMRRHVLIDMANGHMKDMETAVMVAKEIYGESIVLMVGNIAHPKTFKRLSNAGADYIRIGIGNGAGCLTTQQLGVGYPMGSLISECRKISEMLSSSAKIVADGGMQTYSDIIKALALGADYVMLGSIFNKALESAGDCYHSKNRSKPQKVSRDEAFKIFNDGGTILKNFRGMSTKEVQKKWGATKLKTSEGISKHQEVEYTLEGWADNFESYLRSAMSYTDCMNLEEFIGGPNYNFISENAYRRFNK